MKKIVRSTHSTLGIALVLCAFALILPITTSVAFDSQEPGGAEKQNRLCNEPIFTQIDYSERGVIVTDTQALGINDLGQIVGVFVDGEGASHGFILQNGEFRRIDHPKGQTTCYGINDLSQVVGILIDSNGRSHGFVTSPICPR
jgi:probable HAF family extracellular repeat protein